MSTCAATNWPVVQRCLQGNQEALDFLQHLNHVVNVCDDLVDGDEPAVANRVSSGFESAMVHIARSPFYQRHFQDLQPHIEVAIANWHAANDMQKIDDDEMITRAHVLRFSAINVIIMCCRLIGGQAWANQCANDLWRVYPQETVESFKQEMRRG